MNETNMAEEVTDDILESNPASETNEERASVKSTKFPQTRVRNMMKMDPDLHLASQESVFIVCKAVVRTMEIFLLTLVYLYLNKILQFLKTLKNDIAS